MQTTASYTGAKCPIDAVVFWLVVMFLRGVASHEQGLLDLRAPNYSVPGGLNPDHLGPSSVRFRNATQSRGHPLDLVIVAVHGGFVPRSAFTRPCDTNAGILNLSPSARVDLIFRFVVAGTDSLAMVDEFDFTVHTARGGESIRLAGFQSYCLAAETRLNYTVHARPSCMFLTSPQILRPRMLHKLDPRGGQQQCSDTRDLATFLFRHVTEFPISIQPNRTPGVADDGSSFVFAGKPASTGMVCHVAAESTGTWISSTTSEVGHRSATSEAGHVDSGQHMTYKCTNGVGATRHISWSPQKIRWCCQRHPALCKQVYNCKSNLQDWENAWSPLQQWWCCEHSSVG